MASVNFAKLSSAGEAKAVMRHCETEERKRHEHQNMDIQKDMTDANTSMKGLTYQQICESYDSRIRELDSSGSTAG